MAALYRRLLTRLATLLLAGAARLLPARQAEWARAMRAEVLAIDDAHEALAYAWGCFTTALRAQLAATAGQPARLGLVCASGAVLTGCAFMATRQAPGTYAWVNGLSLALAWASFALLPRQRLQNDATWRAWTTFILGALLLWTALPREDAAALWLRLGPVAVQPIWLLCPAWWAVSAPVMHRARLAAGARRLHVAGLVAGLLALAAQAQAPLLAVTALLLGLRAWRSRSLADAGLMLLAVGLADAALARWTAPPPLPFVDQMLQQAFAASAGLGIVLGAAWLGLLLPGLLHRQAREHGLAWAALLVLSLPGWLPAPVLGFGGSFILGYVLSLAVLPGPIPAAPPTRPTGAAGPAPRDAPPLPGTRLA